MPCPHRYSNNGRREARKSTASIYKNRDLKYALLGSNQKKTPFDPADRDNEQCFLGWSLRDADLFEWHTAPQASQKNHTPEDAAH